MATTTTTNCVSAVPVLPATALPRFRPGDLVVMADAQPLVCVVLEEPIDGLVRLSCAGCPEAHLLVSASEVQHLSVWLVSQVSPGARSDIDGP